MLDRTRVTAQAFDAQARDYDAWYDTAEGHAVLALELACLCPLLAGAAPPWLEIGIGSGLLPIRIRSLLGWPCRVTS